MIKPPRGLADLSAKSLPIAGWLSEKRMFEVTKLSIAINALHTTHCPPEDDQDIFIYQISISSKKHYITGTYMPECDLPSCTVSNLSSL
jgi:hypothetical protein